MQDAAYYRSYRSKNPKKTKEKGRRDAAAWRARHPHLSTARRYNTTVEEVARLRKATSCQICHTPSSSPLHIDHCHNTGKLRGALCRKCNAMLGMSGDSIDRLQAGIDYLQGWA